MQQTQSAASPQLVAVLNNQNAIAAAVAALAPLRAALAEQQSTLQAARAALPDVSELETRRERMLAAVALGEATPGEKAQLDAEIEQRTDDRDEAQQAVQVLEQTVDGLQQRVREAQAAEARLREKHKALVYSLLSAHVEQVGAEYAQAAAAVDALYLRMKGLGILLRGDGSVGVAQTGGALVIPAFAGVRSVESRHHLHRSLVNYTNARGDLGIAARDTVVAQLQALGVQIDQGGACDE